MVCPLSSSSIYVALNLHPQSDGYTPRNDCMKVVHVEWTDSESSMGWEPRCGSESGPLIAHSVGFLIRETGEYLLVAHSYDKENDHFNGGIKIPICSVVNVTVLCGIKIP